MSAGIWVACRFGAGFMSGSLTDDRSRFSSGNSGEVYNIGGSNEQENIIIRTILNILSEITGDSVIHEGRITHVTDQLSRDTGDIP